MKITLTLSLPLLFISFLTAQSEYSYRYDTDVRQILMDPADPWFSEIYSPPAEVRQIEFIRYE